jgi:hypothetical protein
MSSEAEVGMVESCFVKSLNLIYFERFEEIENSIFLEIR